MRAPVTGLCAVLIATAAVRAADGTPALNDILARVSDYVVRYEDELSGIVAEEQYTQDSDPSDRPTITHRELTSDLLLVRAEGQNGEGFVQFRDVYRVDGVPVRDRNERLLQLFLGPSATARNQAAQIMSESSRYNIGIIERNVNVPVLALTFMHPRYRSRFKFSLDVAAAGVPKGMPNAAQFAVSVNVNVLHFREVGSPPLISSRDPRGKARSQGRVWVEPETGRILMTELEIETPGVRSTTQVSYQSEPVVGFLVPVEMRETYVAPKRGYRMVGTATYGNFRQFTVKTNETIRTDGSDKDPR